MSYPPRRSPTCPLCGHNDDISRDPSLPGIAEFYCHTCNTIFVGSETEWEENRQRREFRKRVMASQARDVERRRNAPGYRPAPCSDLAERVRELQAKIEAKRAGRTVAEAHDPSEPRRPVDELF